MGFEHFDFVLSVNQSGGIAVLWNNGNILLKETRAIHMLIHDPDNAQNSIISGIYAPAQTRDKGAFWNCLVELNNVIELPWCLMGDVNELLCPNEKLGGQPPASSRF